MNAMAKRPVVHRHASRTQAGMTLSAAGVADRIAAF